MMKKITFYISLMLLSLFIAACGGKTLPTLSLPSEDSAEVGFARDMTTHHAQAVDMAWIIREKTADETLKIVATDIIQTQLNQMGRMQTWLDLWGYSQRSPNNKHMAWMGMEMEMEGLMPGMATQEQMDALRSANGVEAEILFLQLMIAHHYSGVDMGNSVDEMSKNEVIKTLGRTMATAQVGEIALMQQMLTDRGAEQVAEPNHHQDHHTP